MNLRHLSCQIIHPSSAGECHGCGLLDVPAAACVCGRRASEYSHAVNCE